LGQRSLEGEALHASFLIVVYSNIVESYAGPVRSAQTEIAHVILQEENKMVFYNGSDDALELLGVAQCLVNDLHAGDAGGLALLQTGLEDQVRNTN
jgi:hypothetical protein